MRLGPVVPVVGGEEADGRAGPAGALGQPQDVLQAAQQLRLWQGGAGRAEHGHLEELKQDHLSLVTNECTLSAYVLAK